MTPELPLCAPLKAHAINGKGNVSCRFAADARDGRRDKLKTRVDQSRRQGLPFLPVSRQTHLPQRFLLAAPQQFQPAEVSFELNAAVADPLIKLLRRYLAMT